MTYAVMTKQNFEKKDGTKTVYNMVNESTEPITFEQYTNIIEAAPFFKRLGGSEYFVRSYTSKGYKVIEIKSKSPDREKMTVRKFDLDV